MGRIRWRLIDLFRRRLLVLLFVTLSARGDDFGHQHGVLFSFTKSKDMEYFNLFPNQFLSADNAPSIPNWNNHVSERIAPRHVSRVRNAAFFKMEYSDFSVHITLVKVNSGQVVLVREHHLFHVIVFDNDYHVSGSVDHV